MSAAPIIIKFSNGKQLTVDHHPQPNTISVRGDMVVTTEGLKMQEILMVISERHAKELAHAILEQLKLLKKTREWDFLS